MRANGRPADQETAAEERRRRLVDVLVKITRESGATGARLPELVIRSAAEQALERLAIEGYGIVDLSAMVRVLSREHNRPICATCGTRLALLFGEVLETGNLQLWE